MKITSIQIKEAFYGPGQSDKVIGYANVTLDNVMALHDIKIIEGKKGDFIQFPSRHVSAPCPCCKIRNFVLAKYCSNCGARICLTVLKDKNGDPKLYADIVHPITSEFRRTFTEEILDAFDRFMNSISPQSIAPFPPESVVPEVPM